MFELTEDLVIPKGTKFEPCMAACFNNPLVAHLDLGMVNSTIDVVISKDVLTEMAGKFVEVGE